VINKMAYGTIPKTINVDGVTIDKNAEGEIQIKPVYFQNSSKTLYIDSTLYDVATSYTQYYSFISKTDAVENYEIELKTNSTGGNIDISYRVNGIEVTTASDTTGTGYNAQTKNILLNNGDVLTILAKSQNGTSTEEIRDFTIKGELKANIINPY
jgi:hypothetical protein